MSRYGLVKQPHAALYAVAQPVVEIDSEIRELVEAMHSIIAGGAGYGLAANQVGELKRVIVLDVRSACVKVTTPAALCHTDGCERGRLVCVNPVIESTRGKAQRQDEGCLSLPGVHVAMRRPIDITLAWTDLDGQNRRERLYGLLARAAQHEIDHLNGINIADARKGAALIRQSYGSPKIESRELLLTLAAMAGSPMPAMKKGGNS